MIVGAARHHPHPFFQESVRHGGGVGDDLGGVLPERGAGGLVEAHRLARDLVDQGTALHVRENRFVQAFSVFFLGHYHPPARAAQGLVGGGGDDVGQRSRVGHGPARDQPDEMGGVHHKQGPCFVGDGPEGVVVQVAGVGGVSGQQDFGAVAEGFVPHLVHVDPFGVAVHPVGGEVVEAAGEVDRGAVGEVAAFGQAEAEHRVARLQVGEVHAHVGLGPGVGLDVHVFGVEQGPRPVDGQAFQLVHHPAPLVVATPRIAFGVLVGVNRPASLHNRRRSKILRGDQVNMGVLPVNISPNQPGHPPIHLPNRTHVSHTSPPP